MIFHLFLRRMPVLCGFVLISAAHAVPPVVSNVRASQRAGTKQVEVVYDVTDPDSSSLTMQIEMSSDSGVTYDLPLRSLSGAVGAGVSPGANRTIVWNAGLDWNGNFSPACRVRLWAWDNSTPVPPPGMTYIPPGTFGMGWGSPPNLGGNVTLTKGYFMDRYEVSGSLWTAVRYWAVAHGYSMSGGGYREGNHPLQSVSWYDATVWCNARSEMEGLTPCYYTSSSQTIVLRSGDNINNDMVKWTANGYRLPTEAEWERAARGGLDRKEYPWGDGIVGSQANFSPSGDLYENLSPQTTPVGYYNSNQMPEGTNMANGYGLYDMAGNVAEWCWDWSDGGIPLGQTDPVGFSGGVYRVARGGSWGDAKDTLRCANRTIYTGPGGSNTYLGFRVVRGI